MLVERTNIKQSTQEPRRRWFEDEYFDLILWEDEFGNILSFHLCYEKGENEKVLKWSRRSGLEHLAIDDGEQVAGTHKMTPIMVADGQVNLKRLLGRFLEAADGVDPLVVDFVAKQLSTNALDT